LQPAEEKLRGDKSPLRRRQMINLAADLVNYDYCQR